MEDATVQDCLRMGWELGVTFAGFNRDHLFKVFWQLMRSCETRPA